METGPTTGDGSGADARRRLVDVQEQAAATREILEAMGRAGAEPGEILDTIIERAARMCRADAAQLYLVEDQTFRLSRVAGHVPVEFRRHQEEHPMPAGRDSLLGRVAQDRTTQQIADVLADPGYGRHDLQHLAGYRALLSAPMPLNGDVIGILSVWRTEARPFDEGEVDLISTFASQAAIVLRQVELVAALGARSKELAGKVTQLEVLREIGDVVSSSLDLEEVLAEIVSGAVRLTGADGGSIMEYDAAEDSFRVRATAGGTEALTARLRDLRIARSTSPVGRSASERTTLEITDLSTVPRDEHLDVLLDDGWRSLLAVPLVRRDRLVGARLIRKQSIGGFDAETPELLLDVRQPVGAGHRQCTPLRRAGHPAGPSWRSPRGPSPSSSRACRTSSGRRSTRSSASPRPSSTGCSAT